MAIDEWDWTHNDIEIPPSEEYKSVDDEDKEKFLFEQLSKEEVL